MLSKENPSEGYSLGMNEQPWIDGQPASDALKMARRGLYLTILPIVAAAGCIAGQAMRLDHDVLVILAWTFVGASVLGLAGGVLGLLARRREKSSAATWAMILGFGMPIVDLVLGALLIPVQRGRAHRRRGKARLPGDSDNSGWQGTPLAIETPPALADGLAAAWRSLAATETASIAAFASYSTQLLAIGAPSTLIEDAHRDALDEIRHARLCYAAATAFDGRVRGAAPFPAAVMPLDHTPTLESLAIECARESCVLEGASAIAAGRLAEHPELLPELRATLREIADDEARHAAHGWDALDWLLPQLDTRSRERVVTEVTQIAEQIPRGVVEHDDWQRYGIAGPSLWGNAVRESVRAALTRLDARDRRAA